MYGSDVLLPFCQNRARRPRTSNICAYPLDLQGSPANPSNNTECTEEALCKVLSSPIPSQKCTTSVAAINTSIYDGVLNRSFYVHYPGDCEKPSDGWPLLFFFGFDITGIPSTKSAQADIKIIRDTLLSQGVAFVETSMYWNDTYDQRECNSFELGDKQVQSGTCRTCETDAEPLCVTFRNWFTCGNWEGARDIVMMRNIFYHWYERDSTKVLNVNRMAYLGWSVGGHMVSRMIQLSAESRVYPTPKCAVMISGASYHCYSCPSVRKVGEPSDSFQRCNWYAQGSAANDSVVKNVTDWPCGTPFPPFDSLAQNKNGVCPGHTLYPSSTTWWQMNVDAQKDDDVLLTEAAWDTCNKSFDEHPPVLVAQPWEDSDAYWNLAANYYEVLARQSGAHGCRMYAGTNMHGPSSLGNQATINFLLSYLEVTSNDVQRIV